MKPHILSKYLQSPYILIGLDLTDDHMLILLSGQNTIEITQIFATLGDCESFIGKQINNEKIVLIISGLLSSDELQKLENYSKIDAIYVYTKSDDPSREFKCIYTKVVAREYWQTLFKLLKQFWFILGLVIVLISAYLLPDLGASGGPLAAQYTIRYGGVMIIFFLTGLRLEPKSLKKEIFHFRLHLFVQCFSLIFIPFIVFGIVMLLAQTSINKGLLCGVLAMSCISTTTSMNVVMTRNAGGNEYAALLNAVVGNIIGIFISPATIWLLMNLSNMGVLQQEYNVHDYFRVIRNLSLTVLLPLIVGQVIHNIWTEKVMWANEKFHFSELNGFVLLLIVWSVLSDLFKSGLIETLRPIDLITIIGLNAVLFTMFSLLAMYFARLPNICICRKPPANHDEQPLLLEREPKKRTLVERWRFSREDTIAIMFCAAAKTLSKGVTLITTVNQTGNQNLVGLLTLPLILYHAEALILGSIEIILLQQWLKQQHTPNSKHVIE